MQAESLNRWSGRVTGVTGGEGDFDRRQTRCLVFRGQPFVAPTPRKQTRPMVRAIFMLAFVAPTPCAISSPLEATTTSSSSLEALPPPSLVALAVTSTSCGHLTTKTKQHSQQLAVTGSSYREWAKSNYLAAAACQAGVLRCSSNLVAQALMSSRGKQQSHAPVMTALSMGLLGSAVSGAGGGAWSRFLEKRLGRSVGKGRAGDVARSAALSFCLWAPLANSLYLLGLPMLQGESCSSAWECLCSRFTHVMLLELCLFVPYSALAFRIIPLELRPLASSLVGAIFTIGLSMMY